MLRVLTTLLICAAAHAATTSATLTVNGTVALGTTATVTGTATFTGGIAASGTFSATISLTSLSGTSVPVPFTITLPGGTLGGTLQVPISVLEGSATSGTGSGTITSATGTYAGDTGSFPSLTGSGSIGVGGITFMLSGTGTISTGGTVTAPPPSITAVWDAASNTPNLAQGTIFIVKGSSLCPGTGVNSFSVPRPTVAPDGVKITFTPTQGGAGTDAILVYEASSGGVCQLAGILPSTVAVGNYNATVTNGAASAPMAVQVVQSKFAMFTQDQTGNGLAVAQNVVSTAEYDINRLTTGTINGFKISPAYPGQYMVAYGTGMGPLVGGDNSASPAYDFSTNGYNVKAIVGGVTIPVLYAGRAGYAGEDQINFALPANVPTGCAVSFQISVNGLLSPATTLSIAPNASAGACVLAGYTTAQLTSLDNGGTITAGGFSITQIAETAPQIGSVKIDSAAGGFTQITGFELGSLSSLPGSVSTNTIGACTVIQVNLSGVSGQVSAGGTVTYLDAGQVTLTGPTGSNLTNTALTETGNVYSLTIGEEGLTGVPGLPNGVIVGGTYSLSGAGGKGVGPFKTQINLGSPLTITAGLPASVTRSQGLTVNWTGGNSTDVVEIVGYSGSTTGTGASIVTTATEFVCTTTAGAGTFTVAPSVLSQLPATPATSANGTGFLELASGPAPVSFTPSLTAGGTVASTFSALLATGALITYQ
jgi:uncharacterized protein (TIGR03437 family)